MNLLKYCRYGFDEPNWAPQNNLFVFFDICMKREDHEKCILILFENSCLSRIDLFFFTADAKPKQKMI